MYKPTYPAREYRPYRGLADRNPGVLPTAGKGSDEVLPVAKWDSYDLDAYIAERLDVFGSPSCDIGIAKEALVKADLMLGSPTFRALAEPVSSTSPDWNMVTVTGDHIRTDKPARKITMIIVERLLKELPE